MSFLAPPSSTRYTRSTRRLLIISALLGAAYLCLSWRRLFFQELVPVDGNMISVTYPNWRLAHSLWTQPRLPLWNPFRGMGVPHLADPITSALYPPMVFFSGLPGFSDFMRLWVVVHSLIACFFTGALARRWYKDRAASIAAGVLGGFNGFFMARVIFQHQFASAAWLPAVLYFQETASPMGLGICLALQWLAGYPTFSLLTGLFVFCFAVYKGRKSLLCFLKGSALAAGLAAVQWIPFIEFLKLSQRGLVVNPANAVQFSIPLKQLLMEALVPQWFAALGANIQGDPAMVCFYVGLAAIATAIHGVRRGGKEKIFGWLTGIFAILSLGKYLPGYSFLPFTSLFRYPANWLLLVSAGISLLSAAGISRLRSEKIRWAAAALIALDLLGFSQYAKSAWASPRFLSDPPALALEARVMPQPTRLYHAEPLMLLWGEGYLQTREDYQVMRDFLAPSYGAAFDLQDMANFQTLRLKSAETYLSLLEREGPKSPLLNWAGASIVVTLRPGSTQVTRDNIRVVKNDRAEPRVFWLENPAGKAELLEYRPGFVRASVEGGEGTVVLSEADYPGWQVFVDGKKVRHTRLADTFIAVSVPPGRHDLLFKFSPWSFWIGTGATCLSLSLCTLF